MWRMIFFAIKIFLLTYLWLSSALWPRALTTASRSATARPVIISVSCTRQICMPSCENMQRHRTAPYIHCIGYQWHNASTRSSQFWLTRRGRVEVHRIWHLSLVTMRHLVHWDSRTNVCLAVLTRLSLWLLVLQGPKIWNYLFLTVMLQLVRISA